MPQILFIHSSAFAGEVRKENQGSYTRKMARILRETIRGRGVKVAERDVAAKPPGMIDQSFLQAARTPSDQRTPEQVQRLKESDELVGEVLASDVIVISCPVYNFGVPAPLKAWIDNIVREGKTFTRGEGRNALSLLCPACGLSICCGPSPAGRISFVGMACGHSGVRHLSFREEDLPFCRGLSGRSPCDRKARQNGCPRLDSRSFPALTRMVVIRRFLH